VDLCAIIAHFHERGENYRGIDPALYSKCRISLLMTRSLRSFSTAPAKSCTIAGSPQLVYEVIAKRTIDAGNSGERDPVRLRDIGLLGQDELLDRIVDEHGMTVCGWSGEWDHGLAYVRPTGDTQCSGLRAERATMRSGNPACIHEA
jgi:hypothetical protein